MNKRFPFNGFNIIPQITCLTVMPYVWFPISLLNVEVFLQELGIELCSETVRFR